jgi:hypothetical protein
LNSNEQTNRFDGMALSALGLEDLGTLLSIATAAKTEDKVKS